MPFILLSWLLTFFFFFALAVDTSLGASGVCTDFGQIFTGAWWAVVGDHKGLRW